MIMESGFSSLEKGVTNIESKVIILPCGLGLELEVSVNTWDGWID